jgi:uncharacterized delta-60 repeat protein
LLALLASLLILASPAHAAAGDLDPTFGTGGKVTTDFFGRDDGGRRALILQPDGKIVLAGNAVSTNPLDFALARYNTDGSLDVTFGSGGKVTTDFFGVDDGANGAVLQPDGKIVAAGGAHKTNGDYDIALARYNTNGTLDATFGSGLSGKVTTDFGCPPGSFGVEVAQSVALQPDGNIVIAGVCGSSFQVVRYLTTGALDPTFGSGGRVTTSFGFTSGALSVLIQPDGRIVAGGPVFQSGGGRNWALARYLTNGNLDTTFDSDGRLTTDFGGVDDGPWSMTVQGAAIVGVGIANGVDFGVARWTMSDGSLDTTFGTGGKVITNFGSTEGAFGVAVQADNKLVVVGGGPDFKLARYNSDGSLDTTFDSDGKVTTDFSGADDTAQGVRIQPDGKIVVGGYARGSLGYDFALARYSGAGVGPPASLTLSPKTATNELDTEHCVTATVKDALGNPVSGVSVRFSVSGSVNTSGMATTDANGEAKFCYQGPELPGADAIHAFADTDEDGNQDLGEPFDDASKVWTFPISTPLCSAKITEGGKITANNGDKAIFGGNAQSDGTGNVQGEQEYQDLGPAEPQNVKSIEILALTCNDSRTQATIFGSATVDRAGMHRFRIDVQDLGEPGKGVDTYRILLDTGYDSGQKTLEGGNVAIHK